MNIKAILGNVAPFLTAALPTPLQGIALQGINAALGLKSTATQADVEKFLQQGQLTSDQVLALKTQEENFQALMTKMGFDHAEDLEKIAADDRDSARKRQAAMKDWTPSVLAAAITVGFFWTLWFVMTHVIPPSQHDAVMLSLGSLFTAWVAVVTYYFGSSAGSDKKTDLLAAASPINP